MPGGLKSVARACLAIAQADRIARARSRDMVMVLMYHGVTPGDARPDRGDRVPAAELDRQIAFMQRHYEVRRLHDWIAGHAPATGRPGAAITFDDGLRSVRTVALPILEAHRCPATVFICPGLIDEGKPPWFERLYTILRTADPSKLRGRSPGDLYELLGAELKKLAPAEQSDRLDLLDREYRVTALPRSEDRVLLDWEDVSILVAGGLVDFGAHTMTHPNLSRLTRAEQEEEIVESRDAIRRRVGECKIFAWPNGLPDDITPESIDIIRAAGFAASLTAIAGWADFGRERFLVQRTGLGPGMSRRHFAQRAAGIGGARSSITMA